MQHWVLLKWNARAAVVKVIDTCLLDPPMLSCIEEYWEVLCPVVDPAILLVVAGY
jgi:hypothetical protein